MRGKDGKLCFSEKDRIRIWKNYMEETMNEENDWDHMTETGMVEGPIEKVICKEVVIAIKAMKPGTVAGPL